MNVELFSFLPGSILAVSAMDPYSNGKCNTFVGICIQRSGKGLGATFILRNVINGQGKYPEFVMPFKDVVRTFRKRNGISFKQQG